VSSGIQAPTFRRNLLSPSSGYTISSSTLKMTAKVKKGAYDMNTKPNLKWVRAVGTDTSETRVQDSHKRPAGAYRNVRTGYPPIVSISTCDRARGTYNISPIRVDCREPNLLTPMTPDINVNIVFHRKHNAS
jgi:hypothetical protein